MSERSTGAMMFIGERCAFDECHREDFLPFKCSDCKQHYCSHHFRPQTHRCNSHDQDAGDYRVPLRPLCDSPPEGWRREEDPNIAMDRHLSGHCPKLDRNGHIRSAGSPSASMKRTKKTNECSFSKCSKIMVVPILCPECSASFCPSHRAPTQHMCSHEARSRKSQPSSTFNKVIGGEPLSSLNTYTAPPKPSAASSKTPPSTTTSAAQQSSIKPEARSSPFGSIFDKSNKRAKAERISAIKAMQARQRKGILSEADKLKLAEEMSKMARFGNRKSGDSDCIVQ